VTSSFTLRAHGLLALSTVVQSSLKQIESYRQLSYNNNNNSNNNNHRSNSTTTKTTTDTTAITSQLITNSIDLLEKVITILDAHQSNMTIITSNTSSGSSSITSTTITINPSIITAEIILFEVCLLRLANLSSSLSLHLHHLNDQQRMLPLHQRFYAICCLYHPRQYNNNNDYSNINHGIHDHHDHSHRESYHNNISIYHPILDESLQLFQSLIPADTTYIYHQSFIYWFIDVVNSRSMYSISSIVICIEAMQPLVKKFPELAYEVLYNDTSIVEE